jgi:cell division protein FtsI (penicillin-binding protein 3)
MDMRFFLFALSLGVIALALLCQYARFMIFTRYIPSTQEDERFSERGSIQDRNGRVLAVQTRLGNVTLWRPDIRDPEKLYQEMSSLLQIPTAELRDKVESSQSDFVYLKKQADQSTLRAIEEARAQKRIRGVNIEPITGRVYPEQRLGSQIVGFVGDDNHGLAGIEYAYDRILSPTESVPGSRVMLTIDVNVQHILEEIAEETYVENRAEAVMLLAMDTRSGDILGSASIPNFNPNDIQASTEIARMDRPAIWSYEPGSVFKIFSLSSLIDGDAIRENTIFVCDGHYERVTNQGERVTINCLAAHGPVSAREIIIYSCNAGAAYAADRMGATEFSSRLQNLGFGSRTGAGNPGETAGFLRPAERWSDRTKPTISMGQEIAVSALQMVQAATAVANDGILSPPGIVSRIISPDGRERRPARENRRVLRPETAQAMRRYMTDVTSSIGTGWRANLEDLSMAVTTGTAQSIDPTTGIYSDEDCIASCIALIPAEAPSLILYLAIIKPTGASYLGGRIAAPPIREAAEALVDYLGIPRGLNPQVTHSGRVLLPPISLPPIVDRLPDYRGLPKRQLLPLLLRQDFALDIRGDGWVQTQSPPPGTPLEEVGTLILDLQ